MRPASVLCLAVVGLVAIFAVAEEAPETAQEALAETVFQVEAIQQCIAAHPDNRAKRSTYQYSRSYGYDYNNNYGFDNYLDLGLGFRRYDYNVFPNALNYNSRFANYYPEDLRVNLYRLPAARFFNSFYPGPIVRPADGVVDRTYFRVGSYENALTDFRLFPLNNVRSLTTETTVRSDVAPGYVGAFRDFPYEVRVCQNCCNGGNPCIRFTGQTYPFQQVTRNYVYVQNTRSVSSYNPLLK
ncbi:hypothetical protein LOTGIDRAFT_239049 [Lottia gigantea]|uniref:Uncharacterized protein n=1 Tax=Lottia gigantea TaxID=225164 RepID=V4C9P5_LOTGI|nr:hypothetical protein LOTGIDRAFT_239049 [Lottia gigantea]ESO98479.1 hypothetical protein LOTGIDRAFT_239049 [Lottia gigantea]